MTPTIVDPRGRPLRSRRPRLELPPPGVDPKAWALGIGLGIRIDLPMASSGSAAFAPTSVSGCALWLRADMGRVMNGATVATWGDQSGSGDTNKNATAATAGEQPTYTASSAAYGGQAVLSFDALDYMRTGTWTTPLTQPGDMFVVGNTANTSGFKALCDGITNTARWSILQDATTADVYAYAGAFLLASATDFTQPSIINATVNGASSSLRVNSTAAVATGAIGSHGLTGLSIGGTWAGADFGAASPNGRIAEILIYSRVLTSAERTSVLSYLATRYAMTLS